MIIGIVGKAGSGKSKITNYLMQKNYISIPLDNVAKDLYLNHHSEPYNKIIKTFGFKILNTMGEIDKKLLGNIVFNSNRAMRKLNKIMINPIENHVINYINKNYDIKDKLILDGALILNTKIKYYCDIIIYVDAPKKDRIKRLIERGVDPKIAPKMANAVNITRNQLLDHNKPVIIINNNTSIYDLEYNLNNIFKM